MTETKTRFTIGKVLIPILIAIIGLVPFFCESSNASTESISSKILGDWVYEDEDRTLEMYFLDNGKCYNNLNSNGNDLILEGQWELLNDGNILSIEYTRVEVNGKQKDHSGYRPENFAVKKLNSKRLVLENKEMGGETKYSRIK